MLGKDTPLKQALEEKRQESDYPSIKPMIPLDETHLFGDDQKLLNFCLNDYLGLSFHPTLQKNAIKFVLQHGHGSTLSLGCSSHLTIQSKLEEKIAQTLGMQGLFLFPSRLSTHTALLPTLASSHSLILIDRAAHFTLHHAAHMSRAHVESFTHNDLSHLKALLEETKSLSYFTKIIVTETVFSLEGDLAPLEDLATLAEGYNALLYVDDTHALGPLGKKGLGLSYHQRGIDLTIGAFDYGLGASLAFAGCSSTIKAYLTHFCSALKENPLPIPALGVIEATLELLPGLEGERKQLQQRAYFLRSKLQNLGFDTGASITHLIPLFLGSNAHTLQVHQALLEKKIVTKPLLTPDVPQSTARLLLSLSSHHTPEQLSSLIHSLEATKEEKKERKEEILAPF